MTSGKGKTWKAPTIKEKTDKPHHLKLKNFCSSKNKQKNNKETNNNNKNWITENCI